MDTTLKYQHATMMLRRLERDIEEAVANVNGIVTRGQIELRDRLRGEIDAYQATASPAVDENRRCECWDKGCNDGMDRRKLLELIHALELEHQSYNEALGFDAYCARRWEHNDTPADVFTDAVNAGSFAAGLRSILERSDKGSR